MNNMWIESLTRDDFEQECRDRGIYAEPVEFTRDLILLYKGKVVGWMSDNPNNLGEYKTYISEFRVMEIDLENGEHL